MSAIKSMYFKLCCILLLITLIFTSSESRACSQREIFLHEKCQPLDSVIGDIFKEATDNTRQQRLLETESDINESIDKLLSTI